MSLNRDCIVQLIWSVCRKPQTRLDWFPVNFKGSPATPDPTVAQYISLFSDLCFLSHVFGNGVLYRVILELPPKEYSR